MAQTFIVPSQAYPAGVTPVGPFTIAAGSSVLKLSLLRQGWPDSGGVEIISIEAVVSFDNGVSWSGELGINASIQFGCAGGVLPNDKFGLPQLASVMTIPITTPCQMKGRVTLQQPLTTTITIALT